jgi:hemerythrin-like domain-containing protein
VQHAEVQAALTRLGELEEDHRWATPLHAEVEALGQQCLEKGSLPAAEAARFRAAVAALAAMYRRHIEVEDALVLPVAARLLSQPDREAIAEEMAARRKMKGAEETAQAGRPK